MNKIKVNNESLRKIIRERYKECVKNETYIIDVSDLDTSEVTDVSDVFLFPKIKECRGLDCWDMSKIEDMSWLFKESLLMTRRKKNTLKAFENFFKVWKFERKLEKVSTSKIYKNLTKEEQKEVLENIIKDLEKELKEIRREYEKN